MNVEKCALIIEAKRSAVALGMTQILLAMKDARDDHGESGIIYGFVTTGVDWRMVRYDGKLFLQKDDMRVVFRLMEEEKQEWTVHHSGVIDCMLVALTNGTHGVTKDVVAGVCQGLHDMETGATDAKREQC